MIRLQDVSKIYPMRYGSSRLVLENINLQINSGEKIGILGRNGAGKSTLIRLISGAEQPSSGKIIRKMKVSWPLAFGDAFQGNQTGMDCFRFVCRLYGVNKTEQQKKIEFVKEFTELGHYLNEPIKSYSSGMRVRLTFAISMIIEFDCFLIDEVIAVGDSRFHERCHYELFEKRKDRAMILVSHNPGFIKEYCDKASVLVRGQLHSFDNIDEAYKFYETNNPDLLSRDEVIAGYRFILGREPESVSVVEHHRTNSDVRSLRRNLINSNEFREKIKSISSINEVSITKTENILLTREDVITAYKMIIGQVISDEKLIEHYRSLGTVSNLRIVLINSNEFRKNYEK